jgi:peptidyl-tRNA hydrolase ICT1
MMLPISTHTLLLSCAPGRLAARGAVRHYARTANVASEEEIQTARKWLEMLHGDTIPRDIGQLSFSRSSGPGGQNVNKYGPHSSS